MSSQKPGTWESNILETTSSAVQAALLIIALAFSANFLGLPPSANQITRGFWAVVEFWTDTASVNSATGFILNATVILTLTSAAVSSLNRDSESSTISGILTAPGIAIWSKWITRGVDRRYLGFVLETLGVIMRTSLWSVLMTVFTTYIILYVHNSTVSLFVVGTTAILAGISFGALFGRFESGLVLSVKSTAEAARKEDMWSQSAGASLYWMLVPLLAFFGAIGIVNLSKYSLDRPTVWSSMSLFLISLLALIALFYGLSIVRLFAAFCRKLISSAQTGELTLENGVRTQWNEFLKEELEKQGTNDGRYGLPEEVADVLRDDFEHG